MKAKRPSRRRQSPLDQIERLANGCCPVHGLWMGQLTGWHTLPDGRQYTMVGCPRRDCHQCARAYCVDGPWELGSPDDPAFEEHRVELLEGMQSLLQEMEADPTAKVRDVKRLRQIVERLDSGTTMAP